MTKKNVGCNLSINNSFNIGTNRFNEFKFSWNYFFIIVPLSVFFLIILLIFQIDYSYIYELDKNFYLSGSTYFLMWDYSFGDYTYPGRFTIDDFKGYMNTNFLIISLFIFLVVFFALILVFYSFLKSKLPGSGAISYAGTNSRNSLHMVIFGGFLLVLGASIVLWMYVLDTTLKASSLHNYVDYSTSTPAEAISASDYNHFLQIYDFYTNIALYAIVYAVLVLIGFFIITYFGKTLINRTKGIILLQNDFILLPEFTISKDSEGNKQNLKNWTKLSISNIKDFNYGSSTEYYTGSKIISSYWYANTRYTQYQHSGYSKQVRWLIIETFDQGNYAIPIILTPLAGRTTNNESVGKGFLEKFNHIGFSNSSLKKFFQDFKNYLSSYDLEKKVQIFQQIISEEDSKLKV